MTANAVAEAREKYLQAGFKGYLSKPIMAEKLEKALETYLPKEKISYKNRGPQKAPLSNRQPPPNQKERRQRRTKRWQNPFKAA